MSTVTPYHRYLQHNQAFWAREDRQQDLQSDGVILVDMMVPAPGYVIGNALIAKHLQRHLHWPLVALLANRQMDSVQQIAHSFGIQRCVYYSDPWPVNLLLDTAPLASAGERSEEALRQALLAWCYDGVKLGDLAYDSYLRNTGYGTVRCLDSLVLSSLAQVQRDFRFYRMLCQQLQIKATVQGHIVYSEYGCLARAAVAQGAEVFARKPAQGPFHLRRYRDNAVTGQYEMVIPPERFNTSLQRHKASWVARGKALLAERFAGDNPEAYIDAYHAGKQRLQRDELYQKLAARQDQPLVLILSHVFTDAPHSFPTRIYPDYLQWLMDTLQVCAAVPGINWVIKEHPTIKRYAPKETAEMLVRPLLSRFRNLLFCPADINTASFFGHCHAAVTVAGTAALEFPAQGIPVITAGHHACAGHGFTLEPNNREEYHAMLRNIASLRPLTEAVQQRAQAFAWSQQGQHAVVSSLLPVISTCNPDPGIPPQYDYARIYADAIARLEQHATLQDDVLYERMQAFMASGDSHLTTAD